MRRDKCEDRWPDRKSGSAGNELMDEKKARPMLYEFFDKLFEHYEVVL